LRARLQTDISASRGPRLHTSSNVGTRFRLYAQPSFAHALVDPEPVYISTPLGMVGPGPEDARAYAVYPIGKSEPYGIAMDPRGLNGLILPPWRGPIYPPAKPDEDGNFDYLEPGTREFEMAHLFGTVRFALDVWEGYFGRPIQWHFARDYPQAELSILPIFDNAYSGYGFIEVGGHNDPNAFVPYSLNFDVIAHELGHQVIYAEVGIPDPGESTGEYLGFHESAADLSALITSLHFDSVVDRLLLQTHGNLYTLNAMSRMAELSDHTQIRIAANDRRLSEFAHGWRNEHTLSEPLTGAFFDILVDIFHENLVALGAISMGVEDLSDRLLATPEYAPVMQKLFDEAFERNPDAFKMALLHTRDILGTYLADTWDRIETDDLTFIDVATTFEEVDRELNGGRFFRLIRGNFNMRDIGFVRVGPQLAPLPKDSHAASSRTAVPR
jgi:hypothetical protein